MNQTGALVVGASINPVFNTEARFVKKEADYWITKTNGGTFKSKYLVMAHCYSCRI